MINLNLSNIAFLSSLVANIAILVLVIKLSVQLSSKKESINPVSNSNRTEKDFHWSFIIATLLTYIAFIWFLFVTFYHTDQIGQSWVLYHISDLYPTYLLVFMALPLYIYRIIKMTGRRKATPKRKRGRPPKKPLEEKPIEEVKVEKPKPKKGEEEWWKEKKRWWQK